MAKEKKTSLKSKLSIFLTLSPILVLLVFLLFKTVNMPFWDEWEMVPIFEHIKSGHIYLGDFWAQHNEHRIFFPNIIITISAFMTAWNTKVENFIGLTLAIASFGVVLVMLRSSAAKLKVKLPVLLPFGLSFIWFSLVQWENWLWGWQIEWFLSILGISIAVYGLSKASPKKLPASSMAMIIGGSILAQYSLGNGTLIWPLIVLSLVYLRVGVKKISAVGLTGLLTTFLYYYHYVIVSQDEPSKALALAYPTYYVKYVLSYLGRPLSFLHHATAPLGLFVASLFILVSFHLFRHHKARFEASLPWVILGFYAIGSALITGLARLGFGINESYSSRYTTVSSLLLVSTIIIVVLNIDIMAVRLKPSYFLIKLAAIMLLVILVASNYAWGWHAAINQSRNLRDTKSCTHQSDPSDACLLTSYPRPLELRPRLEYTKSIHWGGY